MKEGVVIIVPDGGGRFLVGRRSPAKELAPGYWCPVSGRLEPGETQRQAVEREFREETGAEARAVRKLAEAPTPDGKFRLHIWLAELVAGEPRLANDEHTELRWVTVPELRALSPVFKEDVEAMAALQAEAERKAAPATAWRRALWLAGALFGGLGLLFAPAFVGDLLELFLGNWGDPVCVFAWHLLSNAGLLAGAAAVMAPLAAAGASYLAWRAWRDGGFGPVHYLCMGMTAFHLLTIALFIAAGHGCGGTAAKVPF